MNPERIRKVAEGARVTTSPDTTGSKEKPDAATIEAIRVKTADLKREREAMIAQMTAGDPDDPRDIPQQSNLDMLNRHIEYNEALLESYGENA